MILRWFFSWTNAATVAPTQPGLEYTIDDELMRYTIPANRLHYTLRDEDG